ncbi:MAG: hypothetical protein E7446_02865 [Ruminococcaceae bacterium]|nr:hypothetical protein [Oscillospiraceae bacterium]
MKIGRLIQNRKVLGKSRAGLLLLCGFFLFGAMLGRIASGAVTQENVQQLHTYLLHYGQITQQPSDVIVSCLSLLMAYYRYPLLVFLLGFCTVGIVLIPAVCMSQGFFLSFSIQCFAKAFGKSGVALALSALGVRCLFTVPCTLFLGLWAAADSIQRMKHQKTIGRQDGQSAASYMLRLLGCLLLLLIGALVELFWVPDLINTVLTDLT